jgi:hypothetical protein
MTLPRLATVLVALLLLLIPTTRASQTSLQNEARIVWEEEIPPPPEAKQNRRSDRPLIVFKHKKKPQTKCPPLEAPHPLRTDEWNIDLRWRDKTHKNGKLHLEFAPNGYVRATFLANDSSCSSPDYQCVGTWEMKTSGLCWTLPLREYDGNFYADIHINPFGKQPRLSRGFVIADNRKKFRPIVATFSGAGIGKDTLDLSYRDKKRRW